MGLSRTVSEINCDFGRKLQIFPTFVYLSPPAKGVAIGILWQQCGLEKKTRMMPLP